MLMNLHKDGKVARGMITSMMMKIDRKKYRSKMSSGLGKIFSTGGKTLTMKKANGFLQAKRSGLLNTDSVVLRLVQIFSHCRDIIIP